MKWVIENLVKEPSYLELSAAAKELGFEVQDIRGDYKRADIIDYEDEGVLFVGCIEMCKLVGKQLRDQGCWPATFSTFENYLCTKFYPHFGPYLFNDDYVIVPLSEVKRRLYFFYGLFGKEGLIFMRPDSGDKPFKAGLFDIQDFDRDYEQLVDYKDELVIVSSPKNILGEFRFLVDSNKNIIAVSSYRYQGQLTKVPSAPLAATEMCKKVLDVGYHPDCVFCIDIAQDHDGNCWLLELSAFSSCGLYAMNKKDVVIGVSKAMNVLTGP